MGYEISYQKGTIKIKKENMSDLIKELHEQTVGGRELRWCGAFSLNDSPEIVFDCIRYNLSKDEDYYIIDDFLGEKYGDEITIFTVIAPFCEDGYLQFSGEDGDNFRFVIKDGKFEEVYASLLWDE